MIVAGRLQTSGSDRNSGDSIEGSWVAQRGQSTDDTDRCPRLASRPCSVFPANTREWISLSGPAPSRPGAIDTGDTGTPGELGLATPGVGSSSPGRSAPA